MFAPPKDKSSEKERKEENGEAKPAAVSEDSDSDCEEPGRKRTKLNPDGKAKTKEVAGSIADDELETPTALGDEVTDYSSDEEHDSKTTG